MRYGIMDDSDFMMRYGIMDDSDFMMRYGIIVTLWMIVTL